MDSPSTATDSPAAASNKLIQPLPWAACHWDHSDLAAVTDAQDVVVFSNVTHDEADFIVRAVNCHDELLAAIKALVGELSHCQIVPIASPAEPDRYGGPALHDAMQAVRAAIAKAEDK